jgi:hypothetical protein
MGRRYSLPLVGEDQGGGTHQIEAQLLSIQSDRSARPHPNLLPLRGGLSGKQISDAALRLLDLRTSCPALCRASTPISHHPLQKLFATAPRGWPGQAHGCPVRQKSPVKRENRKGAQPPGVLAGLVPAIHAAPLQETFEVDGLRSAWMPGTSPGRTREGCERLELYNRSRRTGQPWDKPGHDVGGANNVVTSPISRLFVFPGQPPTRGEGKVRAPSFWPTQATSQGDNSGKLRGRRQNIRRL